MLFWIITAVVCVVLVGVYFVTHDQTYATKRKLKQVQNRLAEIEREKAEQAAQSED
jgi:uncharacterized membrane protein (DUF106 family)